MKDFYTGDFIDDEGIQYFQGPWFIKGIKYDYKLIDGKPIKENIDYCTLVQMLNWKVKPLKFL